MKRIYYTPCLKKTILKKKLIQLGIFSFSDGKTQVNFSSCFRIS